MLLQDSDEALAVRRFKQVYHLMNDDVFEQVLWLLHKLRVEADVTVAVVEAPPFRFHALQEVTRHMHLQFGLPFVDDRGNNFV